jgi:hypothetical protein
MIYNKNVEELITERHAFEPTEFNITASPMPVSPGGDSNPPSTAPTTSAPSRAPMIGLEPVEEFLTLTVTDDGALQQPGTPQNLALQDILNNFPDLDPNNGEADQILIGEIYALTTLYYATNGGNWRQRAGWPGPDLPCDAAATWFGVVCDASGQVLQLDLASNDLLGQLPSEIRVLPQLGTICTV